MVAFLRGDGVALVDQVPSERREEMRRHLMGIADARKRGLFACAYCRVLWPLLTDERSRRGVEVAERYLDDELDELQWSAGREAATDARSAIRTKPGDPDRVSAQIARAAAFAAERTAYLAAAEAIEECATVAVWAGIVPTLPDARAAQAALLRDIVGSPFRPVRFEPAWRTGTGAALAQQMYDVREFGAMPILADAIQDAGCTSAEVLDHCRGPGPHVRGCWVVDFVLEKD
jgi:hypothetical protein